MFICHPYQFIFLKPLKAAGTSVECFLEPLCREQPCKVREYGCEAISAKGIVGYRGQQRGNTTYWHHMPAKLIKTLHPNLFDRYHEISIVRNPYQKAISLFLWLGPLNYSEAQNLAEHNPDQLSNVFSLFLRHQIKDASLLSDKSRLLIDSQLVINHVLHFERIAEDLKELINRLSLPLSIEQLGWYKPSNANGLDHRLDQYYCDASLKMVNEMCEWYFTLFGYNKYDSMASLLTSTNKRTRSSIPRFQAE